MTLLDIAQLAPSDDTWKVVEMYPEHERVTPAGEHIWLKMSLDWFILVGPDLQHMPNHLMSAKWLDRGWSTEWEECASYPNVVAVHFFALRPNPLN